MFPLSQPHFKLSTLLLLGGVGMAPPGTAQPVAPARPAVSATAPQPPPIPLPKQEPEPVPGVPPIPPRPASHLLDESGMFPEVAARALSARLLSSQTRTGLGLYLCIHTYLEDETVEDRARRTHAAWLEGKGAGIVVVHDRSTGRLQFAGSDDKRMPDADGLRALYRLAHATAESLPPEADGKVRLAATMTTLADGLEAWQKNGRLPAPPVAAQPARPAAEPAVVSPLLPPWPRPDTFLIDEANVFTDAAAAAGLRSQLDTWSRDTGLRLYIVTVTYPPENGGPPLAERLALEWLQDTMGGVVVYDRSRPDTLSFGGTPQVDRWLSPVQMKQLHDNALREALAAGKSPVSRITVAASFLAEAYVRDGLPLLQESRRWLPQTQRRYLPWVLGAFAGCAGILYLVQRWQERTDRRRATRFLFPEVYVPERLGAPHGGGVTAETGPEATPANHPAG